MSFTQLQVNNLRLEIEAAKSETAREKQRADEAEQDAARGEVRRLIAEASVLPGFSCVYCGHADPPGSPAPNAEVVTAHIEACEKHPMREVLRERDAHRIVIDFALRERDALRLALDCGAEFRKGGAMLLDEEVVGDCLRKEGPCLRCHQRHAVAVARKIAQALAEDGGAEGDPTLDIVLARIAELRRERDALRSQRQSEYGAALAAATGQVAGKRKG